MIIGGAGGVVSMRKTTLADEPETPLASDALAVRT
jgi:hypothetical protein